MTGVYMPAKGDQHVRRTKLLETEFTHVKVTAPSSNAVAAVSKSVMKDNRYS